MPRPARRESLMPGGGFVFSQVHNVMADVPSGNRCNRRNLRLRGAGFMLD
jgi:hypothetical protein